MDKNVRMGESVGGWMWGDADDCSNVSPLFVVVVVFVVVVTVIWVLLLPKVTFPPVHLSGGPPNY